MASSKIGLSRPPRGRERGVTLIELMISVLLALLLTAGAIQVFIGNRTTYAFNEGLSRLQENARFALDHIANDVRMTGYVGCLANLGVNNNLNVPDPFRDDLENGLTGYEYVAAGNAFAAAAADPAVGTNEAAWEPDLPAAHLADVVVPGSDVLVVRHLGSRSSTLVSPFSDTDQLHPADPAIFQQGQILVATDCQKATIFQVTNDPTASITIDHATGGYTPGNAVSSWPTEQLYGLGSDVAALETVVFYVGRGGNGSPALFQRRLRRDPMNPMVTAFGAPEELVDSIDTMQVRYGVDMDNNDTVDSWQRADEVDAGDWEQVRAVEVSLLARAAEEYGTDVDATQYTLGGVTFDPFDDRRLRRLFSTVIGLRNRLP